MADRQLPEPTRHNTTRIDTEAGFPCQDISYAGRGAGLTEGTRSGLWHTIAHAIRILRPHVVLVENVTALRRRGLDTVAADLAASGYDFAWRCLRASDVGAPHRRERLFLLAASQDAPAGDTHGLRLHRPWPDPTDRTRLQPAHPSSPPPDTGRHRRCPIARQPRPGQHHRPHPASPYPRCAATPPADPTGRRRRQGQPTPTGFQGRPHPSVHHCQPQPYEPTTPAALTSSHTNWGNTRRRYGSGNTSSAAPHPHPPAQDAPAHPSSHPTSSSG